MLSYPFNSVTVFVSEGESNMFKNQLAAKAQYDVGTDRQRRIAWEMARRIAISACSARLARGSEAVLKETLRELQSMKSTMTPEEYMTADTAAWAAHNTELARIEAAKLS